MTTTGTKPGARSRLHGLEVSIVTLGDRQLLAGRRVPYPHRSIPGYGDDLPVIGAERDRLHPMAVADTRRDEYVGLGVPDPDRPVA